MGSYTFAYKRFRCTYPGELRGIDLDFLYTYPYYLRRILLSLGMM